MKKTVQFLCILLCMHVSFVPASGGSPLTRQQHAVDIQIGKMMTLSPPLVLYGTLYIDQTDVRFGLQNGNDRGVTEVYRSRTLGSGYVLVGTYNQVQQQFYVYDNDLSPRTTYYYKARVVDGAAVSDYSEVVEATTDSNWYLPTIELNPYESSSIEVGITDNSYNDVYYTVERQEEGSNTWVWLYEFAAPDSGSTFYFTDSNLKPGTKYTYSISVGFNGEGSPSADHVISASAITPIDIPEISYDQYYLDNCGTQIPIAITYYFEGASTELYHADSPNGPWTLEATLGPGGNFYLDHAKPRQTNYYRARAFTANLVSGWSNVMSYTVESDWYYPTFTVSLRTDGTIDVKLVHNTYVDGSYSIWRYTSPNDFDDLAVNLILVDSASEFLYHDTDVLPGKRYVYFLEGSQTPILCVGWPGGGDADTHLGEIVIDTPPNDYTISGFTLVDPVTDQDIGPLNNGAYFEATQLPNIRANVGSNVKSVIFFLNNKRRTDNGPPLFTYWPAQNSDYEPGVWAPGVYTLKATAYSEKNGNGLSGTPLEISFQIRETVWIESFTLVDPVTNQDIGPLRNFDVVDAGLNANIRANTTPNAKSVTFFLNNKRRTDNGAPIFSYFPEKNGDYDGGLSIPGTYVLQAKPATEKNGGGFTGTNVTIQFTVACSTCATPTLAEENSRSIDLYPNPVSSASRLLVNSPPASSLDVQIYDQFGTPVGQRIKATIDSSGEYHLPLQSLQLKKGAYILNVTINGERNIKRFVVE